MTKIREIDPYEVVEQHWPYDGPHDGDTVASALVAAGQLVRYANNASQNPSRLSPPRVDRVVGAVSGLTYGLMQLAEQLAGSLEHAATSPKLYDDRRDPNIPAAAVAAEAAEQLRGLGEHVTRLVSALDEVRSCTNHLGCDV